LLSQKKYEIENINKSLQIGKQLGVIDRVKESEKKKLSEIYEKRIKSSLSWLLNIINYMVFTVTALLMH
jgi:hypothetical protein